MDRQQIAMIQTECQQFLHRATLLIDQCRWQELACCYTEDGVLFRPSDSKNGIVGKQTILESFLERPPRTTYHLLSNMVIDVTSCDQVTVHSRGWLISGEASEELPVKADNKLLAGSFVDTLVRIDDQWFIKCRKGSIELKYDYT